VLIFYGSIGLSCCLVTPGDPHDEPSLSIKIHPTLPGLSIDQSKSPINHPPLTSPVFHHQGAVLRLIVHLSLCAIVEIDI
jgi:hypothetical protein